eukprot:4196703-Amphidinium_carterae.1
MLCCPVLLLGAHPTCAMASSDLIRPHKASYMSKCVQMHAMQESHTTHRSKTKAEHWFAFNPHAPFFASFADSDQIRLQPWESAHWRGSSLGFDAVSLPPTSISGSWNILSTKGKRSMRLADLNPRGISYRSVNNADPPLPRQRASQHRASREVVRSECTPRHSK